MNMNSDRIAKGNNEVARMAIAFMKALVKEYAQQQGLSSDEIDRILINREVKTLDDGKHLVDKIARIERAAARVVARYEGDTYD